MKDFMRKQYALLGFVVAKEKNKYRQDLIEVFKICK